MNVQTTFDSVVITEPMSIQRAVVVNQPKSWNSGICSCFDDMKSCCCVWLCGNTFYANLAQRMNESCCVGFCGYSCGCVSGGHMAMRSAFRNKHGIQGSICDDNCMAVCCLPCMMCQLSRQMDAYGYPPGAC